jgi:hypothetical protein
MAMASSAAKGNVISGSWRRFRVSSPIASSGPEVDFFVCFGRRLRMKLNLVKFKFQIMTSNEVMMNSYLLYFS